jgi:hypothetical protein
MTLRVVVEGDRVHRPAGWWTPTVHALLAHLHDVGFDRVPRPLGIVDGREVLSYVAGDSGPDGWLRVVPEAGLRAFARLLRDFHEATRGFVPPEDARWAFPAAPSDVICHGDFAPWNAAWDGLAPVGLFDFDFAGPAAPLRDVAYALEYVAPFRSDETALRWHGFRVPPDRARRIEVFASAYGLTDVDGLVDAVIDRQRLTIEQMVVFAAAGIEPQVSWVAEGDLDVHVRWSEANRDLFAQAFSDTEPPTRDHPGVEIQRLDGPAERDYRTDAEKSSEGRENDILPVGGRPFSRTDEQ